MTERLRGRGIAEEAIDDAIARLSDAGVLDDGRFARAYAADKRELRGWGPDRIAEALRAKGVGEDSIATALGADGPEQVMGRAVAVLEQSGAQAGDEASRARALALLARRGYPLEVAYDAVRALEARSRAA